jgi:predicted DNA-binding transcriptional regulator YafY
VADLTGDLGRFLVLVPWLAQHPDGVPVNEVCERLGIERRALGKLVDQVAFVGTPDGTPDELVDLYMEGERLHVALPQQFTRAPRFSPEEMLALLLVLAPLRNAPVPGLASDAEALAERLLALGSERARELAARVDDVVFAEGELTEQHEHLRLLERAVREHRVCEAEYYTAGRDALSERRLHPMALIEQRGAWYVVADDHKTFKVERFKRVALSEATFTPRVGFDASRYTRDGLFGAGAGDVRDTSEVALQLRVRGEARPFGASATARVFSWLRAQGGEAVLEGPLPARQAFLGETRALLGRYDVKKDGHEQG